MPHDALGRRRIDCAMTEQLPGVEDYDNTLDALDAPTRPSGGVTVQLEMALPGEFAGSGEPIGHECFSVARQYLPERVTWVHDNAMIARAIDNL